MIRVFMLRHGQSVYQCLKIIAGMNEHGLSGLGKVQIKRIGQVLSNVKFDAVYCSDLKRCRETYQYIENELHHKPSKINYMSLLREKNPGLDFLKTYQSVYPNQDVCYTQRDYQPEGGESMDDVLHRVKGFFQILISDQLYQKSYQSMPMANLSQLIMGEQLLNRVQAFSLQQTYLQAQQFSSLKSKSTSDVLVVTHAGFITEAIKYLKHREGKASSDGDGYLYAKNGTLFCVNIQAEDIHNWTSKVSLRNFSKSVNIPFENLQ